MKKIVSFFLVLAMVCGSLVGCTSSDDEINTERIELETYEISIHVACEENLLFSKYNLEIYVDDEYEGDILHGETEVFWIDLEEGEHEVKFQKEDETSVSGSITINVSTEQEFYFNVKCKNSHVEIEEVEKPEEDTEKGTISSDEKKEVPVDISIISEDEFKNICIEIEYNDLDEGWIGKYVTKEILFDSSQNGEYECGSTENFIEDWNEYQYTHRIYKLSDCRIDKSFPIYSDDVIRIYGVITDIKMNYANGLYYPIIDMYYADYIRRWREPVDETKTIDEIIQERKDEQAKLEAENVYYNSLNSDYTGQTKNIDNMETLSEGEFKSHCDAMNFRNMADSTEDLTGRYVKIHVQLTDHKVFKSEDGKRSRLNSLVDIYNIDDNVWHSNMFSERTGDYVLNSIMLYFVDNNSYNIDSLKKNQELIVYGMVLDYKINQGYHNDFEFLVIYIE